MILANAFCLFFFLGEYLRVARAACPPEPRGLRGPCVRALASSGERGGRAGRWRGTDRRGERAAGRAGPGRRGTEQGRRRGCGRRDGSRGWLVTRGIGKENYNTQTIPAHTHADTHSLTHTQ